jgi:hypothetical protein
VSDASDPGGFLARQPAAVDSAFSVLEAVAELGPGVTGRDLVAALPMSKATVYRILKHLVEQEYLVRTPDLTGFMLGRRVLDLARPRPAATPPPPPVVESAASATSSATGANHRGNGGPAVSFGERQTSPAYPPGETGRS